MMKIKLLLIFAFLLVFAAGALAGPRATRDLVFEDEEELVVAEDSNIADPEVISVRTTLDLTRNGETVSVLPDHQFQSGDKVILRYTTNADGYAYWLAKMSSGEYTLLFPSPQTGMNNAVTRNQENVIPTKGAFRFDQNKGKEELLLVFSSEKVDGLEKVVSEIAGQSGNTVKENAAEVAKVETQNSNKRATRDLVFEDEDEEDVNTQTQLAPKGEPFVAYYVLQHN
jgi:hypothetical protein